MKRSHLILIQAVVVASLLLVPMAAAAQALPTDARLAPVRAQLATLVDQAQASGLPADVLVSKVQEGLAKNVPPARIVAVVQMLSQDLAAAQKFAAPLVGGKPQAALLRALVDAKNMGVKYSDTTSLLRLSSAISTRAVQALADLAGRGYPVSHALAVVNSVATHDASSLSHLASDLDRARRSHAMTQAEVLDAVSTALGQSSGGGLDRALSHIDDSGATTGPGNGAANGRGPNRDTSGHHGKGK